MGTAASTYECAAGPSPAWDAAPQPAKQTVKADKAPGRDEIQDGEGHPDTETCPASPSSAPAMPPQPPPPPANALGLTAQEVGDVRRVHGLLARDISSHCVRMHIKYFRRHPQHLERFCGREARAEPLYYSPVELSRDAEFTARALMHGLAQLQALRCSCSGDANMMASQLDALARAHRGLGLTRTSLMTYRDIMIGYLEETLPQAMNATTKQSWHSFLTVLCDGLADSLEQQVERQSFQPSCARKRVLTSTWVEHELPRWPIVVHYSGGRTQHGRSRRASSANSTCSSCNKSACTCKWDTIPEEPIWRNDSDTFPSLLEDDESECFVEGSESVR